MTNATVLADALVEAGIGRRGETPGLVLYYVPDQDSEWMVKGVSDDDFITDWRVAGKVLESMNWYDLYKFMDNRTSPGSAQAMNMKKVTPRAIIEAWND